MRRFYLSDVSLEQGHEECHHLEPERRKSSSKEARDRVANEGKNEENGAPKQKWGPWSHRESDTTERLSLTAVEKMGKTDKGRESI